MRQSWMRGWLRVLLVCAVAGATTTAGAFEKPDPLPPVVLDNVFADVITGSSPDNSHAVLTSQIDNARRSIKFTGYMLRSDYIADHLVDAAKRGVKVTLLLDGWPVAKPRAQKIDKQELYIARRLHEAGAKVYYLASDRGDRADRRYKYLHAKYAIFDDATVYVTSENFAQNSGHPVSRTIGNRGWTVAVKNEELAKQYGRIFRRDLNTNASDVVLFGTRPEYSFTDNTFQPDRQYKKGSYVPLPLPPNEVHGNLSLERITTPDDALVGNRSILGALARAAATVKIQNLSFSPHWGSEQDTPQTRPSPVAEAVLAAARRGVAVRVMLQPPFFRSPSQPNEPGEEQQDETRVESGDGSIFSLAPSVSSPSRFIPVKESTRDNSALIKYFREIAANESLDLQVNFFWTNNEEITTLHNKGMVLDGRETLVSSINWVENSMKNNREVALLIKSPDVGAYYDSLFEHDWRFYRKK